VISSTSSDLELARILELALEEPVDESFPSENSVWGEYELVRRVGHGGMGVVFEAKQAFLEQTFALKVLRSGVAATEEGLSHFRIEVNAQKKLARHPNIVPVWHVGKHDGQRYMTMPLLRQNLAEKLQEWRANAAQSTELRAAYYVRVARLMQTVANAVGYAHAHGILHRDLKPANILLDDEYQPHIADFGLAEHLSGPGASVRSRFFVGTVHYLAPEQVAEPPALATVAADVYGLGAILYELLTGKVPFPGATVWEVLQKLEGTEPPESPSQLQSGIPPALEAICLKGLERNLEHRYRSAAALEHDLDCFLEGRPVSALPPSRYARLLDWCRQNPRGVKGVAAMASGLLLILVVVFVGRALSARERQAALETNAFIATSQAGSALFQLREYADRVQQAARDASIPELARLSSMSASPPPEFTSLSEGFDAVFVLTTDGEVRAQVPPPPQALWPLRYEYRDYFRGARNLAEKQIAGVHVARAFRSERDQKLKFGVSAPLFDSEGWAGVLVAIVTADSVFGKLKLVEGAGGPHATALLGPRDRERDQDTTSESAAHLVYVVHEKLARGREVAVPESTSVALSSAIEPTQQFSLGSRPPQRFLDYLDPVYGAGEHWLAAFAPVGGTGYFVVVQTPGADHSGLPRRPFDRFVYASTSLLGLLLILTGFRSALAVARANARPRTPRPSKW
jgi:eukaryotic-like serine/threonine-protein kinase